MASCHSGIAAKLDQGGCGVFGGSALCRIQPIVGSDEIQIVKRFIANGLVHCPSLGQSTSPLRVNHPQAHVMTIVGCCAVGVVKCG